VTPYVYLRTFLYITVIVFRD